MKLTLSILVCGLILLGLPFSAHAGPPAGSQCKIILRHDSTGGGAISGPATTYEGKIKLADKDWVCVTTSKGEVWIPTASIQAVELAL